MKTAKITVWKYYTPQILVTGWDYRLNIIHRRIPIQMTVCLGRVSTVCLEAFSAQSRDEQTGADIPLGHIDPRRCFVGEQVREFAGRRGAVVRVYGGK